MKLKCAALGGVHEKNSACLWLLVVNYCRL